jgi:hypothetical protein
MRAVRVIWRLMRRRAHRWLKPASPAHSIAVFDPNEFSELISSGRTKDLETLAKRLSEHHGAFAGEYDVAERALEIEFAATDHRADQMTVLSPDLASDRGIIVGKQALS